MSRTGLLTLAIGCYMLGVIAVHLSVASVPPLADAFWAAGWLLYMAAVVTKNRR